MSAKRTHSMTNTKTYKTWVQMKQRCQSKTNKDYPNYGGRGITVCQRWQDFLGFFKDMGTKPDGSSLGRIDNNGNYEPSNCRWETRNQQARNTRYCRPITFRGETLLLSDWAQRLGMRIDTLWWRLKMGWDVSRAFTEGVGVSHNWKGERNPNWGNRIGAIHRPKIPNFEAEGRAEP